MARRKVIAGNWKMNKLTGEIESYFSELAKMMAGKWSAENSNAQIVLAVPYTALIQTQRLAASLGAKVAAQNVHWESQGAFTGEISAPMLRDLQITSTLVGHSERRQYFAETDITVQKKFKSCLAHQIQAIVCVGETLAERDRGETESVVARQVRAFLAGVDHPEQLSSQNLIVAYEPVWAIGTGRASTSEDAQTVHKFIRKIIAELCGQAVADAVPILYGGSATPKNIGELVQMRDIDGALVGGASLKPLDFAQMVLTSLGV